MKAASGLKRLKEPGGRAEERESERDRVHDGVHGFYLSINDASYD